MIVAYLTFKGTTEQAFNFYKNVLGGTLESVQTFAGNEHGMPIAEADKAKIMHITLATPYGKLMGNDHLDFMGPFVAGNNISLSLHPSDPDEAQRLFDGLAKGGQTIMALEKVFWGSYFGMLVDPWGIKWQVNCPINN